MSDVIGKFKTISKIPRCSCDTALMMKFLVDYCKEHGFKCSTDAAGNIHAHKGKPQICLQSHYDMVCVGDAPDVKVYEEDGFLKAKNSTLGADDGIGVAISMQMMAEFDDLELLFTNDEEIGLWGAGQYEGTILAPRLLNLDSEDDTRVTIGCAGGVDILSKIQISRKNIRQNVYKVELSGLAGGHSGTQIAQNIPNAIKILARYLDENGCKLINFEGGQRRNSIPTSAMAYVVCDKKLSPTSLINVQDEGFKDVCIIEQSDQILSLIGAFAQGVRSYDTKLDIVNDSINLSLVKQGEDYIEVEFFARSMYKDGIERLKYETQSLADGFGFVTRFEGQTSPWKPEESDFAKVVLSELCKFKKDAKLDGVHAGLECGIFMEKMQGMISVCSIGPNVYGAHSINERCEIASVELISKVVRNIIKFYC